MSQELKVTVEGTFAKGGVSREISPGQIMIDVAGSASIDNVQAVGTSWEALQLGDISDLGFIYVENLDSQYDLELSADSAGANKLIIVKAGEFCIFRSTVDALYAKGVTNAVNARIVAFSN